MDRMAALPFTLRRSADVIGVGSITTTRETVHGLLLLASGQVTLQWRLARTVERIGAEIRSDTELEDVREFVVPLRGLAAAAVRRRWWPLGRNRLVLTASDLSAFEGLVGRDGFQLSHPAELVLTIRSQDRPAAREFCAELELALAELALAQAEGAALPGAPAALRGGPAQDRLAPGESPARRTE